MMNNLASIQLEAVLGKQTNIAKNVLLVFLCLITGCWRESGTVKRELAFRISEKNKEFIIEKIATTQTTTFITSEGSKTKNTNKRLGYFYKSDREKKIDFLHANDDLLFMPFGKNDLWIGIKQKTDSELTSIPGLMPEKMIIFSPQKGTVHMVECEPFKCFYIKNTDQVFYQDKNTGDIMILSTSPDEPLRTTKATDIESFSFNLAIQNDIDFEEAIYEDSIASLGMKKPFKFIYREINLKQILKNENYFVESYFGPGIQKGFIVTRMTTNKKCVIKLEHGTNLDFLTEIIDNKLWYYDAKYQNGIFTTELKVRDLNPCMD